MNTCSRENDQQHEKITERGEDEEEDDHDLKDNESDGPKGKEDKAKKNSVQRAAGKQPSVDKVPKKESEEYKDEIYDDDEEEDETPVEEARQVPVAEARQGNGFNRTKYFGT